VVSVTVALLTERFAYRPLRNAPRLAPLITAIGVSVFLQEFVRLFFGQIPGLPEWLVFDSLNTLKNQLIGVVVVVLGVFFLGRALHGDDALTLLYLGGGIAAVTAALSLFLRSKH
jgi:branched-subunit amino acid ABC-type transport system permease component